jgi:hypothetical protein
LNSGNACPDRKEPLAKFALQHYFQILSIHVPAKSLPHGFMENPTENQEKKRINPKTGIDGC